MYTIARNFRREIIIEKSRFICTLRRVDDEAAAQAFIRAMKKEFWDAAHNCSAYIINEAVQRSSDGGEPAGTAGVPMLEVLRKNRLTGTAAVVTRYFGGVKLGAGGLVRAYTLSVAEAVRGSGLAEKVLLGRYVCVCGVEEAGRLLNILYARKIFEVAEVEYAAQARITLRLPDVRRAEAENRLTELLNRDVRLERIGEEFTEIPLG